MYINTQCYILYGYTLLGSVLSHAFSNVVYDNMKDMNKQEYQSMHCNNDCPFGFVTDVEGGLTCACFDPCSMILCLQGRTCVATMPHNCKWEPCRPDTKCEVVPAFKQIRKQENDFSQTWKSISTNVQHDAPARWWAPSTDKGMCSQPLPDAAIICKHKRRRWYYNAMSGKCQRFVGCDTTGNNFSRKRFCKSQCRQHVVHPAELRAMKTDDSSCYQPLQVDMMCKQPRRRWFYNDKTGKCEKFTGCEGQGNTFTRKVYCKTKCRARIIKFRKPNLFESDSKEQPPR